MKYLKINSNKGYYRIDTTVDNWTEIDQINKDHLLTLLKFASIENFEMDEYEDTLLQNPAHNIIYKNIHGKFKDFLNNKTRFQDSVDAMYKQAIDKYKVQDSE
ncbi:hypothetical protein DBB36_19345 [Flavobacterium sp. WLB]|uniref:hypothetical protein n=1 Tax=unclassified Flavobacterium TaxID=196869 RepID=UPI0006ABA426|nr:MULTISPECIES: hypothetical protein [unclassified Flavobacterium]KOP36111.1 hypothetical protein AKO67_22155 [Flavobacterium sp. VMW]OWU89329.1 hypothetical protein APR43_19240 [Flavobacterium sp. NLM]PUU68359.1 hypothetical protein DBB36_19345 [Flavobacterium sp. WLB]